MPPKRDNHNSSNNTSLGAAAAAALAASSTAATAAEAASADSSNQNRTSLSAADAAAEQRQQLYIANSKLCRMVRKCAWMYDRHHANYGKKQVLDKSWTKIAKECSDSVASCKDRWRNIRAAFARSINLYKTNGGPNRVKPYYLHHELSFLVKPMTEGREKTKIECEEAKEELAAEEEGEEEEEEDAEEADDDDEETAENGTMEQDKSERSSTIAEPLTELTSDVDTDLPFPEAANLVHSREVEPPTVSSLKRTLGVVEPMEENGYKSIRLMTSEMPSSSSGSYDADVRFLEVLLPDMKSMNARQKIIFKRKIYQSLQEVLESTTDFPHSRLLSISSLSMTAQTIVNSVANLTERELQKLSAFLQCQQRQPSLDKTQRMQNGFATSTPQALTVIPCAQQNGRAQPLPADGTPVKAAAPAGSVWQQVLPITVKNEVDDVDIE